MRILLVSHPSLSAELGAAQNALNLSAALRRRGHDAAAWSPEPLPCGTRWWNSWARQRQAIERYSGAQGPYDVIDTPAISATSRLEHSCRRLVVRSVQPELRYLAADIRSDLTRHPSPRALLNAALGIPRAGAILAGWRRAHLILCQGTLELAWMRRRFPHWSGKLGLYECALADEDRTALAAVRSQRRKGFGHPAVRYLWIGRWATHKGTRRLVRFLTERITSSSTETFTLAGCGPRAELDLSADWLRAGRVRLVPTFSRAELPALLAAHDAGLFTSDVEGWGLSLNEMLESGLTVFATEAGAVADLKPFFPRSLRPFPPPHGFSPEPAPEDLAANGYLERFAWEAVAGEYERQVLAC